MAYWVLAQSAASLLPGIGPSPSRAAPSFGPQTRSARATAWRDELLHAPPLLLAPARLLIEPNAQLAGDHAQVGHFRPELVEFLSRPAKIARDPLQLPAQATTP